MKGGEGSWLGTSNSRKCHDEDHGSFLSMQVGPASGKTLNGPSSFCVGNNCKCLCG